MNSPTILYEAIRQHHGEIEKEMASWRMANQAKNNKNTRLGSLRRFIMVRFTSNQVIIRQKQEKLSPDNNLI
jgi:hypothetical protein